MEKVEVQTLPYTHAELLARRKVIAEAKFSPCRHAHEFPINRLKVEEDRKVFQQKVDACLCPDRGEIANCAHRVNNVHPDPFLSDAIWLRERGIVPAETVTACQKDRIEISDTDCVVTNVAVRRAFNIPLITDNQTMLAVGQDQDAKIETLRRRQAQLLAAIDVALSELPE